MTRPYPFHPGSKSDGPSVDAAKAIAPTVAALRETIYGIVRRRPQTADEIADGLGLNLLLVRPRVSELRAAGRIEPSGERRKNTTGMSATVWRVRGQSATAPIPSRIEETAPSIAPKQLSLFGGRR